MIFESHDGGKTIRAREFGTTDHWYVDAWKSQSKQAVDFELFREIWSNGRKDPRIASLLDQARILYLLSKDA